ncbi:hypothetical protein IPM65_07660 [Candidatus Roizmanbacteria bacterium]|nr:MAG: hypothetical protein IPM65_07660 [Candidatus Roizmanbacteria bacterium]
MKRLGIREYSFIFPLVTLAVAAVLNELYAVVLLQDPEAVGSTAIFVFLFLIIYFSFHDGRKGGFIAVIGTISYYIYII